MSDLQPIGGLQPLGGGVTKETPPQTPDLAPVSPPPASPLSTTSRSPITERPGAKINPTVREDDPDKAPQWLVLLGWGSVAAVCLGIGSLFLPSPPVDAPKGFQPFTAADQSFTCQLPQPWKVTAMGAASTRKEASIGDGVVAKKSDATVEVTVSSIAGLVTGQLLYGDNPIPAGATGSRAAPIFRSEGRMFKKRFKNFKETKRDMPTDMYPPMTNIVEVENTKDVEPDVRFAEYTADGDSWGMHGKRHGYRMAVGGTRNIVYMVCECSERDWIKLKPAFEHSIASVTDPKQPKTPDGIAIPGGAVLPTGGEVPGFGNSGMNPSPSM